VACKSQQIKQTDCQRQTKKGQKRKRKKGQKKCVARQHNTKNKTITNQIQPLKTNPKPTPANQTKQTKKPTQNQRKTKPKTTTTPPPKTKQKQNRFLP